MVLIGQRKTNYFFHKENKTLVDAKEQINILTKAMHRTIRRGGEHVRKEFRGICKEHKRRNLILLVLFFETFSSVEP